MERILFQCGSNVQYPSLFMFISHTTHTQTMVYKTIYTGHKASPALSATYTRASQHACWRTSLHCLIWAYAEKPALTHLQPICATYTCASQNACWRTSLHYLIWAYAEKPALTRLQPTRALARTSVGKSLHIVLGVHMQRSGLWHAYNLSAATIVLHFYDSNYRHDTH